MSRGTGLRQRGGLEGGAKAGTKKSARRRHTHKKMRRTVEWLCGTFGACVGLLITIILRSEFDAQANEIAALRASNQQLKHELAQRGAMSPPLPAPPSQHLEAQLAAATAVHGQWNWDLLVHELLQPFHRITEKMLQSAVETCFDNGTMYCMRAQVSQGRLYITDYRAIFFDRYYAPSRVMPLLETLRRHPNLPDVDLVVAAVDEPRIKTMADARDWSRTVAR